MILSKNWAEPCLHDRSLSIPQTLLPNALRCRHCGFRDIRCPHNAVLEDSKRRALSCLEIPGRTPATPGFENPRSAPSRASCIPSPRKQYSSRSPDCLLYGFASQRLENAYAILTSWTWTRSIRLNIV